MHKETPIIKSCPQYKGIIFDLDGTLLDTAEGVLSSIRYTISALNYTMLPESVLRTFIGPPVKLSLMKAYSLSEEEANQATEVFRTRYKDHDLFKASVYEGILPLLKALKEHGYLVGVATLKRQDYALTILEHFHIADYCDAICGSDAASKMRKTDVLNECLKKLGLSSKQAVLIGDTSSDGEGAQKSGVDFIAVTYGFGYTDAESWSCHNPVFTANSTADIRDFLDI